MTELIVVLGFALAFAGYGFLARENETRGCGGCAGECSEDAGSCSIDEEY